MIICKPIKGLHFSEPMIGKFSGHLIWDASNEPDKTGNFPKDLIQKILHFNSRQLLFVTNNISAQEISLLSKSLAAGFDTFISANEIRNSDYSKVLRLFFMGATVFTISDLKAELVLLGNVQQS